MNKYILDDTAVEKLLELLKGDRTRQIARLKYSENMSDKDIADIMGYNESVIVTESMLINKIIEDYLTVKKCVQCEKVFYTGTKCILCPECRQNNKKQRDKRNNLSVKTFQIKKKAKKQFKSLTQIQIERAKYNKKNGTQLSYGEYVSLIEGE